MASGGGALLLDQFLHLHGENAQAAAVVVGAMLAECAEQFFQDMAAFELDLLQLRRAENKVERDAFVETALGFDVGRDGEVKGVAVGAIAEEPAAWGERAAMHKAADACTEMGLVAIFADDLAELFDECGFVCVEILRGCPFGDAADVDVAGVDAVDDIVERVGGVVCPVHDLTLDTFKSVERFGGIERCRDFKAAEYGAAPMGLLVVDEMIVRVVGRAVSIGGDALAV